MLIYVFRGFAFASERRRRECERNADGLVCGMTEDDGRRRSRKKRLTGARKQKTGRFLISFLPRLTNMGLGRGSRDWAGIWGCLAPSGSGLFLAGFVNFFCSFLFFFSLFWSFFGLFLVSARPWGFRDLNGRLQRPNDSDASGHQGTPIRSNQLAGEGEQRERRTRALNGASAAHK